MLECTGRGEFENNFLLGTVCDNNAVRANRQKDPYSVCFTRVYIYALPADCSTADLTVLKNMTTNLTLESHNMLNSFAKERVVKSLWISE